jgi:hypothetical protein
MSPKSANRKGNHSVLRKLLGTILIVLGLVAAGLGVASATVWRQSDTVVATATPQGDGALVVTDPGVLELVDDSVTVRATVPDGGTVTLAVGRDVDVRGWVGDEPYSRVTGLSDWDALAVAAGEPTASPSPAAEGEEAEPAEPAEPSGADPANNDMWVAQASGEGSATLRWSDQPGRWSLLAAGVGEGAQAPTVELTWPRTVTTPWLWPGVIAGVVLVLAGLAVLLVRRRRRGPRATPDRTDEVAPRTGTTPAADGTGSARPEDRGGERLESRAETRAETRTEDGPASGPVTGAATGAAGAVAGAVAGAAAASGEDAPQRDERRAVPFVGRRSRRADDRTTTQEPPAAPAWPATTGAAPWPARPAPQGPVSGPGTAQGGAAQPGTAATEATEPPTTTGATRMTRRELRAMEEEARRGPARPITGRLRALTGQIPVVGRGQQPGGDPQAAPAEGAASRAGRAAAWRATWGFDGGAPRPVTPQDGDETVAGTHDSTEGGSR